MQLIDPTVEAPARSHAHAPRLATVDGKRVGVLSNGKLNADLFLSETASLFVTHHGCTIAEPMPMSKSNASAPAPFGMLEALAARCDFLLTANGD